MRTKQSPKVIQLPIPKSDLRRYLEWVIENEEDVDTFMIVCTTKKEVEEGKGLSVFWLDNIPGIELIGLSRILSVAIEDFVLSDGGDFGAEEI